MFIIENEKFNFYILWFSNFPTTNKISDDFINKRSARDNHTFKVSTGVKRYLNHLYDPSPIKVQVVALIDSS